MGDRSHHVILLGVALLFAPWLRLEAQRELGTVTGIVLRQDTSEPLGDVSITLTLGTQRINGTTNREGRFTLTAVPEGVYVISAVKVGFMSTSTERGMPTRVRVGPGQVNGMDVRLQLLPLSVITGRIIDENRQPRSGVAVSLLRAAYRRGGRFLEFVMTPQRTDENGEYRIFDVEPGEYFVLAAPQQRGREFLPTYYPGVHSPDLTSKVLVRPGRNVDGISFSILAEPSYSLRFDVASSASPCRRVYVAVRMIALDGFLTPVTREVQSLGDDRYSVPRLAPGRYETEITCSPSYDLSEPSVYLRPEIVNRDVDLGTVSIAPARMTVWRILPTSASKQVRAISLTTWEPSRLGVKTFAVQPESFILQLPDGHYRLSLSAPPKGFYIASVRYKKREVLDEGIVIDGNSSEPVEVAISQGTGAISGVVRDARGGVVSDAHLVLLPDVKRRSNMDLFFRTLSSLNGEFLIDDVPPGKYNLLAFDSLPVESHRDVRFMEDFAKHEIQVVIEPDSRQSVSLPVTNFKSTLP